VIGILLTDRSVGKGMPAFFKKASGRGVFFYIFFKNKIYIERRQKQDVRFQIANYWL
jgi:hypothetical protein